MKLRILTLAIAALAIPACETPQTISVTPAGGQPVSFTTGKDVATTAKQAALAAAAWYLQQLTARPAK